MSAQFEEHFSDVVDVLAQSLSKKEQSFPNIANRVWSEILSGDPHFNLRQQQLGALNGVLMKSFQDFYYKIILNEDIRKKLTVVVYGRGKETKLDVDCDILYDQIDQTGTDLKSTCS